MRSAATKHQRVTDQHRIRRDPSGMPLYHKILDAAVVPWRLRNGLTQWVESTARVRYGAFYRWLHFGQAIDRVKAVTRSPRHHFFGYYDKTPWDGSGQRLLSHEADFNDRPPLAGDKVGVGIVNSLGDTGFEHLTESAAWNWQQGAMAQWHPAAPLTRFVYNDCRRGRLVGVEYDLAGGEHALFERPVYALAPDGTLGFSLNFARLAVHRPGYGYQGCDDPFANDPHPADDGIWRLNMLSGHADLIVSLADLAARNPKPSMDGAWHYVNHIQPSRDGRRIAFFHIWHRDQKSWEVRLYTCHPDGSALTCLLDTGFISHYDWRDDNTILVWAQRHQGTPRFLLVSHPAANLHEEFGAERQVPETTRQNYQVFGETTLTEDGHCTFAPDGRWVLNDTYPDRFQMRTLMLVRAADAQRIDIARLHSPKARWWGEIRCDLHPRWNRDGTRVCIDSVHEGTRQMYTIDVERWVQ